MKYCVIKNTTKIIDGSENPQEMMLQNAENTGFTAEEVEILTEEQFEARRALEPIPPQELSEIDKLKISQAEQFETILMLIGGM